MVSGSAADVGQAYDQFIYQFATAPQAAAFASGVQALAGRCGSFTATANGQSGTFSLQAAAGNPVGGHPSVELRQDGTLGGSKLILDTLLQRQRRGRVRRLRRGGRRERRADPVPRRPSSTS